MTSEADRATRTVGARASIDRAVLRRIIDSIQQPAFLVDAAGKVLRRNRAARQSCVERVPGWLQSATGAGQALSLPAWVHAVRIDDATQLLVVDAAGFGPENAAETPWARHWRLPPRLARVAACIASGLSDKEIAGCLGLNYQTVRTYVKQVYRRTRLHSRAGVIRAVHSGSYDVG